MGQQSGGEQGARWGKRVTGGKVIVLCKGVGNEKRNGDDSSSGQQRRTLTDGYVLCGDPLVEFCCRCRSISCCDCIWLAVAVGKLPPPVFKLLNETESIAF